MHTDHLELVDFKKIQYWNLPDSMSKLVIGNQRIQYGESQLLWVRAPDFTIKRQITPRSKASNYKMQLSKRHLFLEDPSYKKLWLRQNRKVGRAFHATKNVQCNICSVWINENCKKQRMILSILYIQSIIARALHSLHI